MNENSFYFTTTRKKIEELEKMLKSRKIPYDEIVDVGFFPQKNSKIILDFNEFAVATKDFLDKSVDEVFVRLRKPTEEPKELPSFDEIFKVMEI